MNVDDFFHAPRRTFDALLTKASLAVTLAGTTLDPAREIPFSALDSPYVEGMKLLVEQRHGMPAAHVKPADVIVGTVRMGFGHHRIAHSATTWAVAKGVTPYLHDILAIPSPESETIRRLDAQYSKWSRVSADIGGPVEWLWGNLMKQGNMNSLRLYCELAESLKPLMNSLPRETPVITAYPLNGQIAVACGFRRVINQVIDNFPQYFTVVPGALNLGQTPWYYTRLRQMGVPAKDLAVGGHWVSHDVAANAAADCEQRVDRADAKKPRRFLVPIGGAGAQRKYIVSFVEGLADRLRRGDIKLLINAGDHAHMRTAFLELLEQLQIDFDLITTYRGLRDFCAAAALDKDEPAAMKGVTLFAFDTHFEAFSATDHLMRITDVLVTKPSELAFFPVPKLHIRRVGDHEAAAALRAAELGDGTKECRELEDAHAMVGLLTDESSVFVRMNEAIIRNAGIGVYDGARRAIELAHS